MGSADASPPADPLAACLTRCEALKQSNRRREAQAGYLHALELAAAVPAARNTRRIVAEAAAQALDLALQSDDLDSSLSTVRQHVLQALKQPAWRTTQHDFARHLTRTIDFEILRGNEQEAIEQFEMAARLGQLASEQRHRFARLALKLKRRTFDAAELYVELLESRSATPAEQEEATQLLREILHVDLSAPEDGALPEIQRLVQRQWNFNQAPWAAATLALIELRAGRTRDAWALREKVVDLAPCDSSTLVMLAVVSYRHRQWADALALLAACEQTGRADPVAPWTDVRRLLPSLARVNLLLFRGPETEDWRTALAGELQILQNCSPPPPFNLDAPWVLGVVCSLLGQHQLAIAVFLAAPPEQICWRFAACAASSFRALGKAGEILGALQRWEAAELPPAFAPLLRSRSQFASGQIREAEASLAIARSVLKVTDEPDLQLAALALTNQLAVCSAQTSITLAEPDASVVSQSSLAELGEFGRSQALVALNQAQFAAAGPLLSSPRQAFASPSDLQRLTALSAALQAGQNPEAGAQLAQLASSVEATPVDHLASALWSAGNAANAADFRPLPPLPAPVDHCLEAELARLAAGKSDADQAPVPPDWLTEACWRFSPRTSLYRPWAQLIPQEQWTGQGTLSPHRQADMLFAVDTLLAREQTAPAVTIAAILQRLLNDLLSHGVCDLGKLLAARLRTAALQFFRRNQFTEACTQHQTALTLSGGEDPTAERPFAVDVAEALAQFEGTPPDPVLEVLVGWLPSWTGASAELALHPVGSCLQRFLRIDDDAPPDLATLARREMWSRRLHTIRPDWDWVKRNLAWGACRQSQWPAALEHLRLIGQPEAIDHFLRGRAHWQMRKFALAAEAFAAAQQAPNPPPEAAAWRTIAAAAEALNAPADSSPQLAPTSARALEQALAASSPPAQLLADVQLWRGSVLLAGDLEQEAAKILLAVTPAKPAQFETQQLLLGLARLQAGDTASAITCWPADTAEKPQPARVQALRLWAIFRHGDRSARPAACESLAELRRRGVRHVAFQLCEAAQHLILDRPQLAVTALESNDAELAEAGDPILRPLEVFLAGDVAWVRARAALARQDLPAATEQLQQARGPRAVQARALLVQAGIAEAAKELQTAGERLRQAAQLFPAQPEILARLALHSAQQQRPEAGAQLAQLERLAPAHPLGTLAQADLAEQQGKLDDARELLQTVWKHEPPICEVRERELAATKLGRLAAQQGQIEIAEQWWQEATACGSQGILPTRRLALSLILREQQPERARTLLEASRQLGDANLALRIAEVLNLAARGAPLDAATRLEAILKVPEFAALQLRVQRALVAWCADLQSAVQRFGAAADALEQLQRLGEHDPALESRLDEARLLHVQSLLAERPLQAAALAAGQLRADQVRKRDPRQPLANLLALLCRVVRGERDTPEALSIAEALLALAIPPGPAVALVGLLRQSVGLSSPQLEADPRSTGALRIILANQAGQPEPLIELGLQLIQQSQSPGSETPRSIPFAAADLVRVAALAEVKQGSERAARQLVEDWCERNTASADLSRLRAHFSARRAAAALLSEDLDNAQALLSASVAALNHATQLSSMPGASPSVTGPAEAATGANPC